MEPIFKHKKTEYKRDPSEDSAERKKSSSSNEIDETAVDEKDSVIQVKGSNKKFTFNCHGANHAYPLVLEMIRRNPGWTETLSKDRFDMAYIWHNTPDDEIYNILLNMKGKIINRYPGVKRIARKDNFETMMQIAYEEDETFDFVPKTFIFP